MGEWITAVWAIECLDHPDEQLITIGMTGREVIDWLKDHEIRYGQDCEMKSHMDESVTLS